MSLHEILLTVHIFAAFLIVGGHSAFSLAAIAMRRTASTRVHGLLADLAARSEAAIIGGAVLAIGFGTWLVVDLGYSFGDAWLIAAYVLWVLAVGLPPVLVPPIRRHRDRARALVADGVEVSEELQRDASDPRVAVLIVAETLFLVAFI